MKEGFLKSIFEASGKVQTLMGLAAFSIASIAVIVVLKTDLPSYIDGGVAIISIVMIYLIISKIVSIQHKKETKKTDTDYSELNNPNESINIVSNDLQDKNGRETSQVNHNENIVKSVSDEEFMQTLKDISYRLENDVIKKVEVYDLYISCPMNSFPPEKREQVRNDLALFIREAQSTGIVGNVECPASIQTNVERGNPYDKPKESLKLCYKRILHSKRFVLLYPESLPTSSLFELGIAFAFGKPIKIFYKTGVELPWLIKESDHVADNVDIFPFEGEIGEFCRDKMTLCLKK